MSDTPKKPAAEGEWERQLREMNEALIVSSVRQHELTEQAQKAERALRESEERYRTLIDQVKDYAIFRTDRQGIATTWNEGVRRVLGFDRQEFIGVDIVSTIFTPEDVQAGVAQSELRTADQKGSASNDRWMRRKDGTRFWALGTTSALRNETGELIGFTKVLRDLTEAKRAEEALRQSEEQFRRAIEDAPIPVIIHAEDGETLQVSRSWTDLTGYTIEDKSIIQSWLTRAYGHGGDDLRASVQRLFDLGDAIRAVPFEVVTRGGERRVWSFSASSPGTLRDGRRFIVAMAEDITERKRAEEALREADRRKDEFLAMLGHELRNPLGIISTAAQILRGLASSDAKTEELRDTIERQVIHTSQMLDDLLDVARISRGKIQLKKQLWDFRDIVRETVADYQETLRNNGLELKLLLPDQPLPVVGDRTRLSQALGNLLHNACKFAEEGGAVLVKVESENPGNAVLSVTDAGIGMEPESLGWIFEPFRQADRGLDRSRGGLGLGLALVKGIVQLHGGEVAASSGGAGCGSTFAIRLPLAPAESLSEKVESNPTSHTRKLKVLIIEDNALAARNTGILLEASGHSVEIAHCGADGVEAARKFCPEVVLCDIGLPGMNGYDVARALRQDLGLTDACLISVSGYAHDESRARAAGFNGHILKPVNFIKLEEIIKVMYEAGTA